MLKQLLVASCLMAVCVVIHAVGLASALRRLRRQPGATLQFWGLCSLFIRLAGWMILLHLGEIGIWGAIYGWRGAMADMTSALYFSAVTYTTTGYGDLLLPAFGNAGVEFRERLGLDGLIENEQRALGQRGRFFFARDGCR